VYNEAKNLFGKLEKSCVNKHKQAIRQIELDRKERERRRVFLGLHIDRRPMPLRAQAHADISAIFGGSREQQAGRKQSPEVLANQ